MYNRNAQAGSDGGGSTYRGGQQQMAQPPATSTAMSADRVQRAPLRDNQLSLPKAPGFSFGNAGWGNTVAPRPVYPRNEKALNMSGWSNFNKNFRPIQQGPQHPGFSASESVQPMPGPGTPTDRQWRPDPNAHYNFGANQAPSTGMVPQWAQNFSPEQRASLGAQFDNNMNMGPSSGGWGMGTINNPPMYNSVGAGGGK